jgi:hypothetical protein
LATTFPPHSSQFIIQYHPNIRRYIYVKSLFYWLTDDGYNTQPKHVEAKKISSVQRL